MSDANKEAVQHQPEEVQQLLDLLQTHGKTIGLALALSCTVVIASVFYANHTRKVRTQASILFLNARSTDDLQSIVSKYASTDTAPLALIRLAGLQFSQMNHNGALDSYNLFLDKYADHDMAAVALMGQYHCFEALGRTTQALDGFKAFSKENPDHFLTQESILAQARCLEQLNQLQDAKAVYEQFLVDYPESASVIRANQRLDAVNHIIENGGRIPAAEPVPVTNFNLDSFPVMPPPESSAQPAAQ